MFWSTLQKGRIRSPDFLAMNPLGQVPVFADGDVILRDSTAIMTYLAEKYDAGNNWVPSDPVAKAQMQQWLSVAVHEIMNGPFMVRAIKLFGAPADADAVNAKTTALFNDLFEPHLAENNWLVGDGPTLADLACYSYIARVTEGGFDLTPYTAILAWLKRVEAIDKFPPMVIAEEFIAQHA